MKKIEDYLHLYLGCECIADDKKKGRLAAIDLCQSDNSIVMLTVRYSDDIDDWDVLNDNQEMSRVKPILRPLSDMTEEEMYQLLLRQYSPSEDIFTQIVTTVKFNTTEPKRHLKHGSGVGYSGFKSDGSHYVTGTLSFTRLSSEQFTYLLKQGFDLFGLIDAGLAITKTPAAVG